MYDSLFFENGIKLRNTLLQTGLSEFSLNAVNLALIDTCKIKSGNYHYCKSALDITFV